MERGVLATMKFDIVISHYKNLSLLETTLKSLAQVDRPPELNKIYLIENGMDSGAQKLLLDNNNFSLPLEYHYEDEASLVSARNRGVKESNGDYIIFFDNDLKFEKSILTAYANAFKQYGPSYFYGGPVAPDYELKPSNSLLEYMPFSVKGFDLGVANLEINMDNFFLGANHALSSKIINTIKSNGKVYMGAGAAGEQGGVGEEKRLQQSLRELGYKGMYVAQSKIYHHIPKEVSTNEWIENRYYRYGIEDVEISNNFEKAKKAFGIPLWVLNAYIKTTVLRFIYSIVKNDRLFIEYSTKRARLKGIIDSVKTTNNS